MFPLFSQQSDHDSDFTDTSVSPRLSVYPRPRVRIKEQQQEEEEKAENHFSPPNDKGSILFLRVLESLASPDSSSTGT
ncbi:hypothetical protein WN943_024377 [Citrus x changshan-huyou]